MCAAASSNQLDACRAPEVMRRPCNPEWKAQYADLVEYRDRIFKEHFPSKQ